MNTISWTNADDAAADGDQPARRVRADVRPRRARARSAWRGCRTTAASSIRSGRTSTDLQKTASAREDRVAAQRLPRQRARDRAADPAGGEAGHDRADGARCADRRARVVRGARRADVRPARAWRTKPNITRVFTFMIAATPASASIRRSASPSRTTRCRTTATTRQDCRNADRRVGHGLLGFRVLLRLLDALLDFADVVEIVAEAGAVPGAQASAADRTTSCLTESRMLRLSCIRARRCALRAGPAEHPLEDDARVDFHRQRRRRRSSTRSCSCRRSCTPCRSRRSSR